MGVFKIPKDQVWEREEKSENGSVYQSQRKAKLTTVVAHLTSAGLCLAGQANYQIETISWVSWLGWSDGWEGATGSPWEPVYLFPLFWRLGLNSLPHHARNQDFPALHVHIHGCASADSELWGFGVWR